VTLPDITTLIAIAASVQKPLTTFLQELETSQRRSQAAQKLETRLARLVAALSDQLSIVVEQVEVLARRVQS
jgi:hypothetical protein